MIENLPASINWFFALTTVLTVIFYLYAVRRARLDAARRGR